MNIRQYNIIFMSFALCFSSVTAMQNNPQQPKRKREENKNNNKNNKKRELAPINNQSSNPNSNNINTDNLQESIQYIHNQQINNTMQNNSNIIINVINNPALLQNQPEISFETLLQILSLLQQPVQPTIPLSSNMQSPQQQQNFNLASNKEPGESNLLLDLNYDDPEICALIKTPEKQKENNTGESTQQETSSKGLPIQFHSSFYCPHCNKSYDDQDYNKHIKRCEKNHINSENNQHTTNTNMNMNNQNETEELEIMEHCPLCKKYLAQASFKVHNGSMEHKINLFYGKNVLKKELKNKLICNFPDCNKSFTDIDDFVDHMHAKHSKNGDCLFQKCFNKKISPCKKHFINNHTGALDKFFICPGCKVHEEKCFQNLLIFHMPKCKQGDELLKKINNNE